MVDDEATPNRTRPISARAISSNANESVAPHSTRPTPPARGGSRPRTPASVSAVRDGRSLLATFRQNKRRDDEGGGSHDTAVPTHTNGSHRPSAVKPTAGQSTIDYVERYASNAPGLARNLEAALDASLANRRNSDEIGRSNSHAAAVNGGPNGDAAGPSGGELRTQHGEESSDGAASIATATAAAAAAAGVPATEPSPPRKDAISSSSDESPARPTPEVLRQAARTSQAAFLSSVLPAPDSDFDTAPSTSTPPRLSPPVTPDGGRWGTATDDETCTAISSSDAEGADKRAVARWASMRRLQEQGVGLGSAADHQLTRALQLCRDLRGLKNGVGGGSLSGIERESRLDALQSALHGLEEVLAKRSAVEKAARMEAGALGGPAVLASLLQGDGSHQTQPDALGGGDGGVATATGTAVADAGGWLSGSQLKAFEEQVQARSSLEISALESERRKLRSKVEMFQRQVQLLQREGAVQSPPAANGSSSRIGASTTGDGDTNDFGSAAGEKRFADLLDARLDEERHVQATLEAELTSLRGSLEEKDGLVSALREALRSAATPAAGGGGGGSGDAAVLDAGASKQLAGPAGRQDVAVENSTPPAPRSAGGRAVVPGRGVFAPLSNESGRSQGRYHARSSRLMGAQGPVAAADEAAARQAMEGPRGGPRSGSSSVDGSSSGSREEERRRAEGGRRRGAPEDDDDLAGSVIMLAGGASSREDLTAPSRRGSGGGDGDGVGAHSAAAFSGRSGTPAGVAAAKSGSTPAAPLGRVSPSGVSGRKDGDGYVDIISQATAVTGTALKSLWDSARVVGSRVGLDGGVGSELPRKKPLRRGNSSHAVLIL